MVKMKKYGGINKPKAKNENSSANEELQFILWKAELNKELMEFWKVLNK